MNLHNKISDQMKDSMRAKDQVRLTTLRGVLAAFTNELKSASGKVQEKLEDKEAVAVIRRLVKQRKDSIEQFKKGDRQDLVDAEEAELKILEEFLPAQMSEEKIREIVLKKLAELKNGSTGSPQVGILIGAVMKETAGQADGSMVKKIVEELL